MAESADVPDASAAEGIPRLAVALRLDTKLSQTPARFSRMTKLLDDTWCKIERGAHALENTSLYKHSQLDGVAFGLHLSGMNIIVCTCMCACRRIF